MTPTGAWLVLARDVSDSVHVGGMTTVAAALVIDDEQGLILGNGVDATPSGAVRQALTTVARTALEGGGFLGRILCPPDLAQVVRTQVRKLGISARIIVAEPGAGAENVFDSLVGYLAGRRQPTDLPSPEDWSMLYRQTQVFAESQPWLQLSDAVHLEMELRIDASATPAIGVVMGNAGITYGFALYPGDAQPGRSGTTGLPSGTVSLTLDPAGAIPSFFVEKARRYQWPEALSLWPVFFAVEDNTGADLSSSQVAQLTLGLAAALHYASDRGQAERTGQFILSGGRRGGYQVSAGERASEPATTITDIPTIDRVLDEFLADRRSKLAPRTVRIYESVLDLLRACLNNYGYEFLSEAEDRQFQAAYRAGDEQAFCHLFGPEKIADNLSQFLRSFMLRRVMAGQDLLRASGTVTGKLMNWLLARGYLAPATAHARIELARTAARDLPRATRLASILSDAALAAPLINVDRLADADYVEDLLFVTRVEPGRLWFGDDIGPIKVPAAATDLAQPGWMISLALARVRGRWRIVEVGDVVP